jgi:hypothetical protein
MALWVGIPVENVIQTRMLLSQVTLRLHLLLDLLHHRSDGSTTLLLLKAGGHTWRRTLLQLQRIGWIESASAAAVDEDTFYNLNGDKEDDDQFFNAAEELNKDENCESKRAKTEDQNESIPPQFNQSCLKHFGLSKLVIATLVAIWNYTVPVKLNAILMIIRQMLVLLFDNSINTGDC